MKARCPVLSGAVVDDPIKKLETICTDYLPFVSANRPHSLECAKAYVASGKHLKRETSREREARKRKTAKLPWSEKTLYLLLAGIDLSEFLRHLQTRDLSAHRSRLSLATPGMRINLEEGRLGAHALAEEIFVIGPRKKLDAKIRDLMWLHAEAEPVPSRVIRLPVGSSTNDWNTNRVLCWGARASRAQSRDDRERQRLLRLVRGCLRDNQPALFERHDLSFFWARPGKPAEAGLGAPSKTRRRKMPVLWGLAEWPSLRLPVSPPASSRRTQPTGTWKAWKPDEDVLVAPTLDLPENSEAKGEAQLEEVMTAWLAGALRRLESCRTTSSLANTAMKRRSGARGLHLTDYQTDATAPDTVTTEEIILSVLPALLALNEKHAKLLLAWWGDLRGARREAFLAVKPPAIKGREKTVAKNLSAELRQTLQAMGMIPATPDGFDESALETEIRTCTKEALGELASAEHAISSTPTHVLLGALRDHHKRLERYRDRHDLEVQFPAFDELEVRRRLDLFRQLLGSRPL